MLVYTDNKKPISIHTLKTIKKKRAMLNGLVGIRWLIWTTATIIVIATNFVSGVYAFVKPPPGRTVGGLSTHGWGERQPTHTMLHFHEQSKIYGEFLYIFFFCFSILFDRNACINQFLANSIQRKSLGIRVDCENHNTKKKNKVHVTITSNCHVAKLAENVMVQSLGIYLFFFCDAISHCTIRSMIKTIEIESQSQPAKLFQWTHTHTHTHTLSIF